MKNIVKFVGLMVLILFSFFYSDRVASVIASKDSFMIKINEVKDLYEVKPIHGVINDKTIIPGINGKKVNVDKSYKKIREVGTFSLDLLVYDTVKPDNRLDENNDKYIIQGNGKKNMVSIVFIVDDDRYLDKVKDIVSVKKVVVNYFISDDYLVSNSSVITGITNSEIYNYGDRGKYTPDNLIFANNLITRITKNEAKYCLVKDMDDNTLSLCSKNNLFTILPNMIISSNPYLTVKNGVSSGSIILMDLDNSSVMELAVIIDYINGKGLDIVGLSELLRE